MRLDCLFISRKGRKGRRTSNANYAIAEVAADFVATAGAVATETIGANTAPARRRALAPSDNSVDSNSCMIAHILLIS